MTVATGRYKAVINIPFEKVWRIEFFFLDEVDGWEAMLDLGYPHVIFRGTRKRAVKSANRQLARFLEMDAYDDQKFEIVV